MYRVTRPKELGRVRQQITLRRNRRGLRIWHRLVGIAGMVRRANSYSSAAYISVYTLVCSYKCKMYRRGPTIYMYSAQPFSERFPVLYIYLYIDKYAIYKLCMWIFI